MMGKGHDHIRGTKIHSRLPMTSNELSSLSIVHFHAAIRRKIAAGELWDWTSL